MIKSEQNTFMFSRILAFEQNWTCKHKVGHYDLIQLAVVSFIFINFEYQGSTNVSVKFITNYISWFRRRS